MKRKLLSVFTATIIFGGLMCKPAVAVENNISKLEQNSNVVNEQCKEIEVVGKISFSPSCWHPEEGLYAIYMCCTAEDEVYYIEARAVKKLSIYDYVDKKVRLKGTKTGDNRIDPIEIEVVE